MTSDAHKPSKLDHVAIAVRDLEGAVGTFEGLLGITCERIEVVEEQSARVAFFEVGGVHLELVSPIDDTAPIARSIQKRGEGLHHVCFVVEDLKSAVTAITKRGAQLAGEPTAGARGSRVVFVHPKSTHGVLVELVEKP